MLLKKIFDILLFLHHQRIVNFIKKNNLKFDKYIDVGTHEGELLELILKIKNIKTYCFEPQKSYFLFLKKKFKKTIVFNYALDKEISKKFFFINKLDGTSTLSKFNKKSFYLRFKNYLLSQKNNYENKTFIKTTTMDILFKNKILKKTLLKIDVEGYELNVLKGAKNKLKEISYILIEQQFGNQYKNSDFSKVDKYLKDNNFKVIKSFYYPTMHYKDILYSKI